MNEVGEQRALDVDDAEQAVDTLRERLIREAVGYDDICRSWRREQSVRIRALALMVEALGGICGVGEPGGEADPDLVRQCSAMLALLHRDMARLVGQPWPSREPSAEVHAL